MIYLSLNTPEQTKEEYRKNILNKAKNIEKVKLTREYIRNNPDLLEASSDQIERLFGSWGNFLKNLGFKTYFKSDKDIIESVKKVSEKLNLQSFSRETYQKNKEEGDPSPNAQYHFMKKVGIKSYFLFIQYCLTYQKDYSEEYVFNKEKNKEKELLEKKIQELLDKGYPDKTIQEQFGIDANAVRRYRLKNNIPNNYNAFLEKIKKGE